jgi:hypothetical protein
LGEQRLVQQVLQQILPEAQQLQFLPQTALALEEAGAQLCRHLLLNRITGTAPQVCNVLVLETVLNRHTVAIKHNQALVTVLLVRTTTLGHTHLASPPRALHVLETLGAVVKG